MNHQYSPGMSNVLGAAQMMDIAASESMSKHTLNGIPSAKPRMAEAFGELERAIEIMAEVAVHVSSRTEALQRPRHPEPARPSETGQIRPAVGPVVAHIESLTEKVRAITSGMQDTLQRLEV